MPLSKQIAAEFLGTFWLVLGGVGSAVLGLSLADGNIGILGVALAFGLTVVTGAYAFGHISGAHFNPAVSIGLWAGGRFPAAKLLPYIVAQAAGAIAASAVIYVVASGLDTFSLDAGFASNGFGDHSPAGYSLAAAIVIEVVLTFVFVLVIHGATARPRAGRVRAAGHRPHADADPPHQHPGDEHVGEPGPQLRPGAVRRRLGAGAVLGLHRLPDRRRRARAASSTGRSSR